MPVALALAAFKDAVAQCDSLIANAHRVDTAGSPLFPPKDQRQITVAAFLNMFIAWEAFLDESLAQLMAGAATISGTVPVRFATPLSPSNARSMVTGVRPYFDFSNHNNVRTIANIYFENGYPYEPHLSSIDSDLSDLKTMRNASAHISFSTQTKLEGLAIRIFNQPRQGITLYDMITAIDPRSAQGETVFLFYKSKLLATAELISNG